ncbi:hypothetical protein RclHR1_02340003 [Rhizophagus clarus]|uniref:Cytochrome P450 n=1 Tax=Rhizophagus clarus TaxID=94130 RepID=A0A2Z6RQ78_9GLOM|nr:hypothetical protein RclHR1_02340003 [Rhizophagus clarus]
MLDLISLVSFSVLGVIGWITYKMLVWPFYISPLRKIPGPPCENLFTGNLRTLMTEEPGFDEPQHRWVKKYGNIVKYHGLFNEPTLYVADSKIIQEITLSKTYDFVKPYNPSALAIAGVGLVFSEGENHKRQRKMMNPAFTYNNIKEMVPTFIRVTTTLKGLIEKEVNLGKSNINLTPYLSKTTLDVIGLVGFNYEFNSLTSSNELATAYDSLFNQPATKLRIAMSLLSRYVPLIRQIPIDINKKFRDSYDEELKYQIMTFLIAGHETTNVTTCWALYLLAQHPHEQDLLREELVKAFPDKSNFNPTYDEINSLEHLNCNTEMFIGISALHKSTEIWGPTADKYNPKRWLDPSLIKNVTNLNYLPFFNGARGCIGNKVALAEMKIILGMLIRNFVFQPIEGFHIRKKVFPVPKPDPYLGLIVSIVES